ncbi:MAG: hypothetical protein ACUVUF_06450 [Candidatus Bathycorpusculaceae bacterium]
MSDVLPLVVGNFLKEDPMVIWRRVVRTWANHSIVMFVSKEFKNTFDPRKISDLQNHFEVAGYALA